MGWARPIIWTAGIVFVLDQLSKILVVHVLDLQTRHSIDVLPPFFNLRMAWNRGINFGLFSNDADVMRWVLITIALIICGWVIWWMRKERPGRWAMIAAGLLLGGALGNVIDRIIYGAVADFINMSCCGIENPFAFNLADAAIFAGAIGLILLTGNKKDA